MAEVVASDPLLRADLRICRAHGWTWAYWIDDLDDLERSLWRAFDAYEASVCPGCGQPRDKALWVTGEDRAQWSAGFQECGACYELGDQQEAQRIKDAQELDRLTATSKKPHLIKRPVTSHRHWLVQPADTPPE